MRFRFDCMYHVRKLDRVLHEEHRHIVGDQVVVTFFSIEFCGKAAHVTWYIHGAPASRHSGEPCEDRCFLSGFSQKFCFCIFFQ